MPDEYGRFNLNDGLNLAQGIMSVKSGMRQQTEFDEDRQAQDLAQSLMKDPEYKIDQGIAPHIAFKANVMASEAKAKTLMADNAYLQNKAERYKAQLTEDMPRLQKITSLADSGDDEGFYSAAESFYNDRVYDGAKVKFMPGEGKMSVTEKDGKTRMVNMPSKENILKSVTMYSDPQNYLSVNLHNDSEILKSNADQMRKAEQLYSADGDPLGVSMAYITDPKTRKQGMMYFNSYTGDPVDIDKYMKSGAVTADTLKNSLEIYSKKIGIQKTAQELINSILEAGLKQQESGLKTQEAGLKTLEAEKKKKDLAKGEDVKSDDMKSLERMIYDAGDEPSQAQVATINGIAGKYGLTFKQYTTEEPGTLYGTNEVTKWGLIDDRTGQPATSVSVPQGAGLNSAAPAPKKAPAKPKSVPKRKPGESVADYLKRTGM